MTLTRIASAKSFFKLYSEMYSEMYSELRPGASTATTRSSPPGRSRPESSTRPVPPQAAGHRRASGWTPDGCRRRCYGDFAEAAAGWGARGLVVETPEASGLCLAGPAGEKDIDYP